MPDFVVKGRKTGATTETTVTANTRDEAIAQVVASAAPGEEFQVMSADEVAASAAQTAEEEPSGKK